MPFTQSVVNETLHVANIISGVFRRAITDVNIKGYTIPKGWKVFTSLRALHLDQHHFKDARVFNPWRWQVPFLAHFISLSCSSFANLFGQSFRPANSDPSNLNVFMPFGRRPIRCPEFELARVELSVFFCISSI